MRFRTKMQCDASRGRKTWSCFLGLGDFCLFWFCFFPPSLPSMFWVLWHPAATVLGTGAAQDKARGDGVLTVPWSIPTEKGSIRMDRPCRAAHRGHGVFAWCPQGAHLACAQSKGSTRLLLHGALMAFTMTAEQKQWFHEVIARCTRSHFIGPTCS